MYRTVSYNLAECTFVGKEGCCLSSPLAPIRGVRNVPKLTLSMRRGLLHVLNVSTLFTVYHNNHMSVSYVDAPIQTGAHCYCEHNQVDTETNVMIPIQQSDEKSKRVAKQVGGKVGSLFEREVTQSVLTCKCAISLPR